MKTLKPAIILFGALTVLTGLIYPLAITGIAQAFFYDKANGSLLSQGLGQDSKVIGSRLLSQKFEKPQYFWPRPSAVDYNPIPSGGSNLGPTSKKLKDVTNAARLKVGINAPQELIFASASGLDPHLTLAAIQYQIPRVAAARRVTPEVVEGIVKRQGGEFLNVLELNIALDRGLR